MNKDSKDFVNMLNELHEIIKDENVLKSDILKSIWRKTKSGELVWKKFAEEKNCYVIFYAYSKEYNINLSICFGDYKHRDTILEILFDFFEPKGMFRKYTTERFLFELREYPDADKLYNFLVGGDIKVDAVNKPKATRFNKPKVDTVEDHVRKVVNFS